MKRKIPMHNYYNFTFLFKLVVTSEYDNQKKIINNVSFNLKKKTLVMNI